MLIKVINFIKNRMFFPKWQDIEYFDEAWKSRIKIMAQLINEEKTVLDLGCGQMWLKNFLPEGKNYIGCDYTLRDEKTIICDFNKKEFPSIRADVCFVSGCLEYVEDVDWFIDQIKKCSYSLIISYCTTDLNPGMHARRKLGWVNHMSSYELKEKISLGGYILIKQIGNFQGNDIYKFVLKEEVEQY